MLVIGVLASFGVPKFMRSLEQSRVDMAATNLRAIWTAQRLYWLKHQTYAQTLDVLVSDPNPAPALPESFLDASIPTPSSPGTDSATYVCQMSYQDTNDFTVTATRSPTGSWSGQLTIDQTGVVTGSITGPDGNVYIPTPQFQ
jgi:type II secretory pathway pseudopilin PulG